MCIRDSYDTETSQSKKLDINYTYYDSFFTYGNDLYYRTSDYYDEAWGSNYALRKYDLTTGKESKIDLNIDRTQFIGIFGDTMYFASSGDTKSIFKMDVRTGECTQLGTIQSDAPIHDLLVYHDQVFITSGTGAGDGFAVWNGKEFDYKDPGISEHGLLSEYGGMEFLGSKLVGMTWNGIDNSDDKITQLYDLQ